MNHHRIHLRRLAREAGYDVDLDELTIATAHHPAEVSDWISAACDVAGLAALSTELTDAAVALTDVLADTEIEHILVMTPLLTDVTNHLTRANTDHDRAVRDFAARCATLAAASGLLWPISDAAPTRRRGQ